MGERYKGNFIVGLMRQVDKNLTIPRPEVEIGGKIVRVGPLKIRVGPEGIDSWKRIEAEKQAAIASGKPFTPGHWQTKNPLVRFLMRAVARKAGFPGIYD